MPVVKVEGAVAALVSLLPVGRTGAMRLVVIVVVGEAEVEAGEEEEEEEVLEVMHVFEVPHSAPF